MRVSLSVVQFLGTGLRVPPEIDANDTVTMLDIY